MMLLNNQIKLLLAIALSMFSILAYSRPSQQNLMGNQVTKDGPITICSDALTIDQAHHRAIYQGNVFLIQTNNATIQCNADAPFIVPPPPDQPIYNFGKVLDPNYAKTQQKGLDLAKKVCKRQKGCRYLSGHQLTIITHSDNQTVKKAIMIAPEDQDDVYYYSFPFAKDPESPDHDGPIFAQGNQLNLLADENELVLKGHAYLEHQQKQFIGDEVQYDLETGTISSPKGEHRSTVIIHNQDL